MWWSTLVIISTLGRHKQNFKVIATHGVEKASLGYIGLSQNKTNKTKQAPTKARPSPHMGRLLERPTLTDPLLLTNLSP